MSDKMIVLVCDLDDAIHGEINVLDSPEQATRFVESLLESGFERERIRVFLGDEMQMEVHHRPVVSLLGNERTSAEEPVQQEAEVAPQESEEEAESVTARSATLQVEEDPEPFVKNGVRFSTQFRPA